MPASGSFGRYDLSLSIVAIRMYDGSRTDRTVLVQRKEYRRKPERIDADRIFGGENLSNHSDSGDFPCASVRCRATRYHLP